MKLDLAANNFRFARVKDEIWKTYGGQIRDSYSYAYNRYVGPACRVEPERVIQIVALSLSFDLRFPLVAFRSAKAARRASPHPLEGNLPNQTLLSRSERRQWGHNFNGNPMQLQNGEKIRQPPQSARIDITQFRETAGLPQSRPNTHNICDI